MSELKWFNIENCSEEELDDFTAKCDVGVNLIGKFYYDSPDGTERFYCHECWYDEERGGFFMGSQVCFDNITMIEVLKHEECHPTEVAEFPYGVSQ